MYCRPRSHCDTVIHWSFQDLGVDSGCWAKMVGQHDAQWPQFQTGSSCCGWEDPKRADWEPTICKIPGPILVISLLYLLRQKAKTSWCELHGSAMLHCTTCQVQHFWWAYLIELQRSRSNRFGFMCMHHVTCERCAAPTLVCRTSCLQPIEAVTSFDVFWEMNDWIMVPKDVWSMGLTTAALRTSVHDVVAVREWFKLIPEDRSI